MERKVMGRGSWRRWRRADALLTPRHTVAIEPQVPFVCLHILERFSEDTLVNRVDMAS